MCKEVVPTAVQPQEPRVPGKERIRRLAESAKPFDPDEFYKEHPPLFESEEEREAFIAEIYAERERNPA